MRIGLALAALLLAAACGDSGNNTYLDKGPGIIDVGPGLEARPVVTETGISLEASVPGKEASVPKPDGVKPPDGAVKPDGVLAPDGVKPADIQLIDLPPLPNDGPKPADLPITTTDGPKVDQPITTTDGPKTDTPQQLDGPKTDTPQQLDAPKIEAKVPDAPKLEAKVADLKKTDATVVTKNDAGKYMCTNASGTHLCKCNDGIDNENDGKIDLLDPCCKSASWDSEGGTSQCTDCVDNDSDGFIDDQDTACTGPIDNDESSFATGIPGDNMDPCKEDCFFDGDSGSGNDKCEWTLKCDPKNPGATMPKPCPYDPNYKNCPTTQTQQCLNFCLPLTPNGCDCFGCCDVYLNGTMYTVKLVATCDLKYAADPAKCPPCTKVAACLNTCGKCETCYGHLPEPGCFGSDASVPIGTDLPPPPTCCCGYTSCSAANPCGPGFFCLTGCCIPIE